MRTTLLALTAALSLLSAATRARAESEGNGDPFPFRASGLATLAPKTYAADSGSAAYPDLNGRPSWIAAAGGLNEVPPNGSEGAVQTANSLPRGSSEGTVAYTQARSVQQYLTRQEIGQPRIVRTSRVPQSEPRG